MVSKIIAYYTCSPFHSCEMQLHPLSKYVLRTVLAVAVTIAKTVSFLDPLVQVPAEWVIYIGGEPNLIL